jgi:cysteine desulfurase / selenocysteine lyase
MSTSESPKTGGPSHDASDAAARSNGFPSLNQVTAWANEFFKELGPAGPGAGLAQPDPGSVTDTVPPSAAGRHASAHTPGGHDSVPGAPTPHGSNTKTPGYGTVPSAPTGHGYDATSHTPNGYGGYEPGSFGSLPQDPSGIGAIGQPPSGFDPSTQSLSGFGAAPQTPAGFGGAPSPSGFGGAPSPSGFGSIPSVPTGLDPLTQSPGFSLGSVPQPSNGFGLGPQGPGGFGSLPQSASALDPDAATRFISLDQPMAPVINALSKQPLTVAEPAVAAAFKYRPDTQSIGGPGAAPQSLGKTAGGATGAGQQASRHEAFSLMDPSIAANPSYYFMNPASGARPELPNSGALPTQPIATDALPYQDLSAAGVPSSLPGVPANTAGYPGELSGFDLNNLAGLAPADWQDPVGTLPSASSPGARPSASNHSQNSLAAPPRPAQFEVEAVRAEFPILRERVQGRQLVWLDNAATTQKPQVVIDRLAHFYAHENSNIHRGAHTLAARATDAYEDARDAVRRFLNASSSEEIVFVRGTTEGINLIAQGWGRRYIEAGDEIIVSRIEHHSNIVPWQMLCAQTGARLRVAEVDDTGQIMLEQYERLFNSRTRLVSVTHVSNALGTIVPVAEMIQIAHRHGVRIVIDGAQSVCHLKVDVQSLDPDFYVFSGHKVFGPTGIGAVYGKKEVLESMPPWQGGGSMIADVTFEKSVYQPPPTRFEAGTGNIADAVGLAAALDYLEGLGLENVARHEHELLEYGTHLLEQIPGLHMVGTAKEKAAVLGFVLENMPSEQVGRALASEGIAVRAGHHCAQPALRRFGHETTVRPSLAVYNNRADIDTLVGTLRDLQARWLR